MCQLHGTSDLKHRYGTDVAHGPTQDLRNLRISGNISCCDFRFRSDLGDSVGPSHEAAPACVVAR